MTTDYITISVSLEELTDRYDADVECKFELHEYNPGDKDTPPRWGEASYVGYSIKEVYVCDRDSGNWSVEEEPTKEELEYIGLFVQAALDGVMSALEETACNEAAARDEGLADGAAVLVKMRSMREDR